MNRTRVFAACLALVGGTLLHGICVGEPAAESLAECTQVVNESARLRCYDDHMKRLGHKIAPDTQTKSKQTTAVGAAAPSSPAQIPAPVAKQSEFGMAPEVLRKKRAAEAPPAAEVPQELIARVQAVSERVHGELSIELDNDQVWVETQRTGGIAPEVGEIVTIRRGALGSYFLTRQSGRALRVKRIQ